MKNILFIGAGALGVAFADYIQKNSGDDKVYFVADPNRKARYEEQGLYCNGKKCEFSYLQEGDNPEKIYGDLLFFCVKTYGLEQAIESVRAFVKPETTVISVMNGISSERIIRERLKLKNVLDGLSMGATIQRQENHISYDKLGYVFIGAHDEGQTEALAQVKSFFDKIHFPYQHHENIQKKMWEKFMVNVGNNQTASIFGATFGQLSERNGEPYKVAHQAMAEVIALAQKQGVIITKEDVEFWDKTAENLNPEGKCSMLQDIEAGRQTELEHFAGEVIRLGKEYGISTPCNEMLYEKIKNIESRNE